MQINLRRLRLICTMRRACYTARMMPLFPLHPRLVHFPIALLVTGSVLALAYMLRWRRPALATTAWLLILLGWISVFFAVVTGLIDRNSAPQDPEISSFLSIHTALGFALIAVYGLMLYERLRSPDALDSPTMRWRLILLAVLGLVLVLVDGWVGGTLVYKFGVGVLG
ncbi:MAG: DUF2231 domain-containing protein [Anaerolineae bacterium]|nr:DUF2231 domain-containing protein [Anaerolineae bacterium]